MDSANEAAKEVFSVNPQDYELGQVIGFGSSAIVYMVNYKPLHKTLACKMIDLDRYERNQIDELRKEVQVMTLNKHPNLLPILASFVMNSKLMIITPYMAVGSCLDILKHWFPSGLEETVIASILVQALQGLDYLHKSGLIHRDFKAGNMLMDKDGLVQLADFGVSSSLMEDGDRRGTRKTFVGTPCWMAPEVMEMSKGYNNKADVWSVGITAIELAHGQAPFAKYPPMKVIYLTLSNNPPTLDRNRCVHKYSKTFKEFVDLCLQRDPAKRPTVEQLLKHAFFKQAKKKQYLQQFVSELPPLVRQIQPEPLKSVTEEPQFDWDFSEDEKIEPKVQPVEIKKGRFRVVESAAETPKDAGSASAEIEPLEKKSSRFEIVTHSEPEEVEKKSRFQVEKIETKPSSIVSSPSVENVYDALRSDSKSISQKSADTRSNASTVHSSHQQSSSSASTALQSAVQSPRDQMESLIKVNDIQSQQVADLLSKKSPSKHHRGKSLSDPLMTLAALERQIRALAKDYEDLRIENIKLKEECSRLRKDE